MTKKSPKANGGFFPALMLVGLIGAGIWYFSPSGGSKNLPPVNLGAIADNLPQGINPKTLVVTQRVDNPIAGNTKAFLWMEGKD